ncbi:MAG: ComEC/Rec2 family competence protein [Patescibacteria group bacterium]
MLSEYFFGFSISFIVGIALESFFNFGYSFGILCAFLAVIIFLARRNGSRGAGSCIVSLVLLGCALGILRVDYSLSKQNAHTLNKFLGDTVSVSGIIKNEPDVREEYTNIVLGSAEAEPAGSHLGRHLGREINSVLYGENQVVLEKTSNILVRVPVYPVLRYGDEVTVDGKITPPKNFASKDGAKDFDYQAYLAKDDIYYQMYFPKVTLVSHGKGNIILEKLFALKTWLMGNIVRMIPEPEASLAGGITLGVKQSLGDELLQKFRDTGVAHIVVLSGYNIAVIAGIISRVGLFVPFTLRLGASAIGVILFALMVGGGATVVRATIMALIIILARVLGREGDALRALVLAGGLMVFVNPMILLHDVSFQLSFSATLALVVLVPVIEKYFFFVSSRVLREIVVTTFATQIFVLPLILYHMGSVSLIGLISNIFILPVVPFAMLAVAFTATLAWVPLVSSVFAFCAYLMLAYIVLAVEFFVRVPFASLHGISFPFGAIAIAYALLGFYIAKNFPHEAAEEKSEYEF